MLSNLPKRYTIRFLLVTIVFALQSKYARKTEKRISNRIRAKHITALGRMVSLRIARSRGGRFESNGRITFLRKK